MAAYNTLSYIERLQNEIKYLKNEVRRLNQPHKCASCCRSVPPLVTNVLPPLKAPEDDVIGVSNGLQTVETRKDDAIGGSNDAPTVEASEDDAISCSNGLQVIQYRPESGDSRLSNSTKHTPSRTYADELSDKILSTDTSTTLNCTNDYCVHRIREILKGVSIRNTSISPSPSAASPWKTLKNFASIIEGTKDVAKAVEKIHAFQQLIFVSACVVLKIDGVEDPLIDDAIRLCVSKSKASKTLDTYAFQKCPQWIGEQISKWGDLATEYLFQSKLNEY